MKDRKFLDAVLRIRQEEQMLTTSFRREKNSGKRRLNTDECIEGHALVNGNIVRMNGVIACRECLRMKLLRHRRGARGRYA
jgi:hypothetical protein